MTSSASKQPVKAAIDLRISQDREKGRTGHRAAARGLRRHRQAQAAGVLRTYVGQRLALARSGGLAPILNAKDPAKAFREGSLDLRRQVIDTLATVTLYPSPRGRKGFDPASVDVDFGDAAATN